MSFFNINSHNLFYSSYLSVKAGLLEYQNERHLVNTLLTGTIEGRRNMNSLYKLKVDNWAHGQLGVVLFPKNLYKINFNQWSKSRILRLNEEGPLFDRNHRTARLSFLQRRRKPLFSAFVGGDCSLAIELTVQRDQEACNCDWQCNKNYKLTLFAFEWVHEAVSIILEMFCACFVGAGVLSIIVGQREKSVRLLLLSTSLNSSSPSSPSRRFFLPDVKKKSHFELGVKNFKSI